MIATTIINSMSVKPERDDDERDDAERDDAERDDAERDDAERDDDERVAPVKQVKKLLNMHVPFRE
ncbi:MAG: hypothetical protein GWP35_06455 [Proteobacteria bacterium]|nr:hypothetical protein [Pseudomonadota bacterium]